MTVTEPHAVAAPIVVNQYPAKVTGPDGVLISKRCRAIITPELLVAYEHLERKIKTIVAVRHTSTHPELGVWFVETEAGTYLVGSGSGCGCGSPLRSMPSPPDVFMNVEPWPL